MRRNDKEIQDTDSIRRILSRTTVCRIAMVDGNSPYVVPVNFVVHQDILFFHSAPDGKKIDILRKNPRVCFEVDVPGGLVENDIPCQWSMKYKSVVGFGQAFFVESREEKKKALDILMAKYSGRDIFSYADEILDKVAVIGILIEEVTGKKNA